MYLIAAVIRLLDRINMDSLVSFTGEVWAQCWTRAGSSLVCSGTHLCLLLVPGCGSTEAPGAAPLTAEGRDTPLCTRPLWRCSLYNTWLRTWRLVLLCLILLEVCRINLLSVPARFNVCYVRVVHHYPVGTG